jgi:DNA-binding MarR family transcriptional regulator
MTSSPSRSASDDFDSILASANALLGVVARSVIEVEDTVTTPQLRVLVFLASRGTQNLGAIAEELRVHPSNATRTCDKLLKAGLITRTEDPVDRRFVQLDLAPDGRLLVDGVLARRRAAIAAIVDRIPSGSRRAVAEGFTLFANAAGTVHPDGRFVVRLPEETPRLDRDSSDR